LACGAKSIAESRGSCRNSGRKEEQRGRNMNSGRGSEEEAVAGAGGRVWKLIRNV